MKRFLLLVALILSVCILICGCQAKDLKEGDTPAQSSQSTGQNVSSQTSSQENSSSQVQEPVLPEISPECVGIYIPAGDGTAARARITEFSSVRTAKKDIDCFEILASAEDKLAGGSFRTIWQQAWDGHTDTQGAKIGFWIEFSLPKGVYVRRQILKPSDAKAFYDYLEVYLYDDVHQTPGVWYTHLEDEDMKPETVITSIKLTSGSKIAEVGDITLTAFIYQGEDCFDERGEYIGDVYDSVVISRAG